MVFVPQLVMWLVAIVWLVRTAEAIRGLPAIPNLTRPEYDVIPTGLPSITVIVPARNEAANIRACLESLLAQDYPNLRVIAVNDRSDDSTGSVMDALAAATDADLLQVLHIADLSAGWLGKTHAMGSGAALAAPSSDFLLFTDADVLFAPSAIRRALAFAVSSQADHLVIGPTTIIRRWDEGALLSLFQVLGFFAVRLWKIADARALRDSLGIGAFNLLRTSAYLQLGGWASMRMEIVEDLALGRRVKEAGLRQRFCFGPGLVSLHWAAGVPGLINVMTKNIFAVYGYRIWMLSLGGLALYCFCINPFFAVFTHTLRIPAALTIAAIAANYWNLSRFSTIRPYNFFFEPFAAALLIYALLRSMLTTLLQGGVRWRGTFYPLRELRKHRAPLRPRRR